MPVHPDLLLSTLMQENNVERARQIEIPYVNTLGIDLRFDKAKVVFARVPGKTNAAPWRQSPIGG